MNKTLSKKTLPIPLILVLPLIKAIFELGAFFFLCVAYCLITNFFEDLNTNNRKVWLIIFLLIALFIFVVIRGEILIGSKKILSKIYQNLKARDIEKEWSLIEMFLDKTFYFPQSRIPISIFSNLSLVLMLIYLILNMPLLVKVEWLLLLGSPFILFYVVFIVYLFECKIED